MIQVPRGGADNEGVFIIVSIAEDTFRDSKRPAADSVLSSLATYGAIILLRTLEVSRPLRRYQTTLYIFTSVRMNGCNEPVSVV